LPDRRKYWRTSCTASSTSTNPFQVSGVPYNWFGLKSPSQTEPPIQAGTG
jgi:hypothetical protein